jgi:hypothetical protein
MMPRHARAVIIPPSPDGFGPQRLPLHLRGTGFPRRSASSTKGRFDFVEIKTSLRAQHIQECNAR